MRYIRTTTLFCIGFGVLYFVLIELRGFMAARQVPVEYFRFFGKEHQERALFTMNVAFHLVPEVLALIGGMVVCAYIFKGARGFNARIFALGAATSYLFWLVFYQVAAQVQATGEPGLNWQPLLSQFRTPWWATPLLLSPAIGVGIGIWLTTRRNHAAVRTEA